MLRNILIPLNLKRVCYASLKASALGTRTRRWWHQMLIAIRIRLDRLGRPGFASRHQLAAAAYMGSTTLGRHAIWLCSRCRSARVRTKSASTNAWTSFSRLDPSAFVIALKILLCSCSTSGEYVIPFVAVWSEYPKRWMIADSRNTEGLVVKRATV